MTGWAATVPATACLAAPCLRLAARQAGSAPLWRRRYRCRHRPPERQRPPELQQRPLRFSAVPLAPFQESIIPQSRAQRPAPACTCKLHARLRLHWPHRRPPAAGSPRAPANAAWACLVSRMLQYDSESGFAYADGTVGSGDWRSTMGGWGRAQSPGQPRSCGRRVKIIR